MKTILKSSIKKVMILLFLVVPFFTLSCKNSVTGSNNQVIIQTVDSVPEAGIVNVIMKRGKAVYEDACLVCHQADGAGVPMTFPPIKGSDIIAGSHDSLIRLVLDGKTGAIEIKGDKYDGEMPPQRDELSDQQIADLLTFIRNTFGSSGDTISAKEVAAVRK